MVQTAEYVSYGKPKIDGGIKVAPVGTKLPTSEKEALASEFKSLGYVSEDGLTNNKSTDTDDIQAWGGDTVLTLYQGSTDEFTYTLIETMNVDVLKFVYGEENVTGTLETGIKVSVDSQPRPMKSFVVDMILKGGVLKRLVIPKGEVIQDSETSYIDNDASGFGITVKCNPDEKGKTHYEYIGNGSGSTTTTTRSTGA
ncbi:phage tail protein [Anaerococcus nagyae]|uniref:phage tail tube protein n=1 Tax=Anaerococcus nagyae TaxID=1755241 RepID=UPI003735FB2B